MSRIPRDHLVRSQGVVGDYRYAEIRRLVKSPLYLSNIFQPFACRPTGKEAVVRFLLQLLFRIVSVMALEYPSRLVYKIGQSCRRRVSIAPAKVSAVLLVVVINYCIGPSLRPYPKKRVRASVRLLIATSASIALAVACMTALVASGAVKLSGPNTTLASAPMSSSSFVGC